jgi:alpha-L-fucosidase
MAELREDWMAYTADWRSLRAHPVPQWFRDAKFGIYTHWGIYSVPAIGPNTSWYGHNMYREGTVLTRGRRETNQYTDHLNTYGHYSKFGYKDFIPMFTAEKFDPDAWAELFAKAGARFAGPVAEHHDGFSMWPTRTSRWNAAEMGPKRDIVGLLEKAYRARGMKYMVAMHHAEHWWFFPHWLKDADVADPRFTDFYGEPHNTDYVVPPEDWDREAEWAAMDRPSRAFLEKWKTRLHEVVEGYRPDYIWFDFGLKWIHEQYKQDFLAYYYNKGLEWGRDVVVTYKWADLPPGTATVDIELGRMADQTYYDWITDTTVDDGQAWGYMKNARYKSATELLHYLVDNVAKNGNMLLNVGPKADGTIPEEAQAVLTEMGKWLAVNGEAIYESSPWYRFGEGPTRFTIEGAFGDMQEKVRFTGEDFRFTVKGNILYAIAMAWPARRFIIRSAGELYPGEVAGVELLGHPGPLEWRQTPDGLEIERPDRAPGDHAYTFKITRHTTR